MLTTFTLAALLFTQQAKPVQTLPGAGDLTTVRPDGKPGILCPLENTKVIADIAGFGARVTVIQTFTNPSKTPIEAIYTFPLPADAAIDRMRIQIGNRIVNGIIQKREDARAIYEAAKAQGQSAALLDQERPNVFTQSVANIMPGGKIQVEISYVQVLKYEDGQFEFNYPMVVGPRYLANTTDPNKVDPPRVNPSTRAGTNVNLTVNLDAGATMTGIESVLHKVDINRTTPHSAKISLAKADEIPNRDFILRYKMADNSVKSAFLTFADPNKGGFFTLILLPPKAPTAQQISPREMIFVVDQSGSQSGFPIDKSKELTLKLIDSLRPIDTFNVMGFSSDITPIWPAPRPVNEANIAEAKKFVQTLQANGGTELAKAVEQALAPAEDPARPRYIIFNTDGFIGDELRALQAIKKGRVNSRIFTFGIGNGVNRFLIDAMSAEGKGDSEVVTLNESAEPAANRFLKRINTPVLTNIEASFDGIAITDVLPSEIPDVFSSTPVILKGRYSAAGHGKLLLKGRLGGQPWSQTVELEFPSQDRDGSAIATLWAREKITERTRFGWMNEMRGEQNNAKNEITYLALEFGLMSEYTSFVAVEQRVVNVGGKSRTVNVPVDLTDGVDPNMGSGDTAGFSKHASPGGSSGGFGGGGGGRGGSMGSGAAQMPATTASPAPGQPVRRMRADADEKAKGESLYLAPSEKEREKLKAPDRAKVEQALYESKVAKKLREAKTDVVEIQLWLEDLKPETLARLKKLGVTIDVTDKRLKLVLGTVSRAKLRALSLLDQVKQVQPLQ